MISKQRKSTLLNPQITRHPYPPTTMAADSRRKSNFIFFTKRRSILVKFLFFFFLLYSGSLLFYFLNNQDQQQRQITINNVHARVNGGADFYDDLSNSKPWPPYLPSFLPWHSSHRPPPRPRSCEAYFGNGFSERVDVLEREGSLGFRCFYSETLRSSVCEGGGIRMDPSRIQMSRGGEELETVIGRKEEKELPKFEKGAFQIEGGSRNWSWAKQKEKTKLVDSEFLDRYVPRGAIKFHTMRELLRSFEIVESGQLACDQWIDTPTLLVTRFEYANLFHTVTDWYSAYTSSRVTNLPKRPDLIFIDGHCKTQLEETWKALFSNLRYAKKFTGPVCFRHAILSPLGYETAMFKGLTQDFSCQGTNASILHENPDDHKTARISEFGEMIRASFSLPVDDQLILKGVLGHNVLFVRREDYLAHPRHDGKVQSRLSNEQEIFDSLKSWATEHTKCKINLVNGLFAHMPMKDQLQAIQQASVVIGAHGAGLIQLVSATKDTKVLEIISSLYNRPHFRLISEWKGLDYHAIHLSGSYAQPLVVIKELNAIMRSLGC